MPVTCYFIRKYRNICTPASGIPERNGRRHATEMCSLALDIAERVSRLVIPHMLDRKLELRIGIHTGLLYHDVDILFMFTFPGTSVV